MTQQEQLDGAFLASRDTQVHGAAGFGLRNSARRGQRRSEYVVSVETRVELEVTP